MLTPLINYCKAIYPLADEVVDDIVKYAEVRQYKKDEFILKPGMVSNYACFVLKGIVRSYYIKEAEEITTKFLQEASTITSIYSFYSRKPGNEYIMALEETVLACFHYDNMQKLYKEHPSFNAIGRVITEKYLYFSEIELYNLRKVKAEDRYHFFERHFPQLMQRVPLKYIATYLGMNLETLSRIRGRKR